MATPVSRSKCVSTLSLDASSFAAVLTSHSLPQLRFASGSLKQYLHVAYDSKYPETAAVQADDPEKILFEFIPPSYAKALDSFEKTVEEDAKEFVPLGNKVASYRLKDEEDEAQLAKAKGKGKGKQGSEKVFPERNWIMLGEKEEEEDEEEVVYEAYATTWATPGFKEFHRRMQIFVLLYIEGAQYIDEDDTRWEFITLSVSFLPLSRSAV